MGIDRVNGLLASAAIKVPCEIVTNTNFTKSGIVTIGSYTTLNNDRVLQATAAGHVDDGIWVVNTAGTWQRAPDFDGPYDATKGTIVPVNRLSSGSVSYHWYKLTNTVPFVIGTDALVFEETEFDAAQLTADLAAPSGAGLIGTQQPGSTLARTQLDKNADSYTLRDFPGIDFTGATDSTAAVQVAFAYCAANGIPLYSSKGTVIVKDLEIPSGLIFKGWGRSAFTFKLPASASAGSTIMYATGKNGFSLHGFTADGNKSNQTNYANLLLIQGGSYDYEITEVYCKDSKGSSGSGITVNGGDNNAQGTSGIVERCKFSGNEGIACRVTDDFNISIIDNHYFDNGDDIAVINLSDPPPASPTEQRITISRNRCLNASRVGISVSGYIEQYIGGLQVAGTGKPTASSVVISDNVIIGSTNYGLVFQSTNATISSNVIRGCGSNTSNGGVLLNGSYYEFNDNVIDSNFFYGIDAGGSIHASLANNTVSFNGVEGSNGASGLNLGAAQNVSVKNCKFIQNGDSSAGAQINIPGYDGGTDPVFPTRTTNIVIDNCEMYLANTNQRGVSCGIGDPVNVVIRNCNVFGGASNNAYVVEANQFYHSKNLYWNGAVVDITIAAAASVVIPDYSDEITISGTGNVDNIRTYSANNFAGAVRAVRMTNNGSGYTPGASFAVTFSGGGGSGATGTGLVGNDGKCYAVIINSYGSGYTSAPTADFSAGSGTGAAGNVLIGCNNTDGNYLTVYLSSTAVLKNSTGNMSLSGGDFTGNGFKSITLFGRNGGLWYEVSRS